MRTTFVSSLLLSSVSVALAQLTLPTLPGSWQYEGCYTDVPGRTIGASSYASGTAMTNEACIAYCDNLGFQYAGTEYSVECFCGASLNPAAELVAGAQCNMACSGDATQPCGGGSRLTLFRNPTITGPQTNPGVGDYTHLGCYSEGTTGRTLTHGVSSAIIAPGAMTVAACIAACDDAGFNLAGVEYASECFCGNSIQNGGAPATGCNMLCNGNNQEFCGAGSRLNIYANSQYSASTTAGTTATTATTATGTTATTATTTAAAPSQPEEVDNFEWHGCRTEATGIRALSGATFASDTMTLQACRAFCADYTFFGVEYSRECYCGNSFNAGSTLVAATQCSMTCMGNPSQYCGAGDRLSVYAKDGTAPPPTTSTTAGSTTTSPLPTITGLPTGWESYGCYREGTTGRALPHQLVDSPSNTPAECASRCIAAGYSIAGVEYGAQCFCANALYNGAATAPIGECNVNCPGNAAQKCGGGDRLNIVAADPPQTYAPPAPQQGIANWTYQGCFEDNVGAVRTFHWQVFFPGVMTPKMCLDRCSSFGYQAAGLEYGEECFCGDPRNIGDAGLVARPESECGIVCPGNASAICGGGSRLTTYFWSGTPLYQYDYPQDYRAGQYQFFVNGLNIPLITQETITGKVSFISKAGTGPGNETGAYELDPSRVGNGPWQSAWRELHLKTDVFCAAGVTLPDKAGRQLNIGGWSGDSTYGTRLYWPDDNGAGDWGVNDWQEDVAKLSLQEGRWYPSAMIMANGSVFVIGGEVGSNAAAVPTIEVLPRPAGAGTVHREWLARTDPNNLYPFVAVLPSGGIFVAYWNEARVIDPVTFDDVKVLPNAPGAVNDPLAGRTYPMQGTAVLLPQKAPYTEPLGVLICGGSTIGVANALDNCVSTYPDVANPTWTLERMPTFRVMPIMAPLPDGTYWIGGGAKHGVAGFGLANRPNLNSLLYDPSKPVGQRITVAANTTIARMYHSEAITLLDGRVLVSGSNPEDGVNPEEYRVEVYVPPYLLKTGVTRPTFSISAANKDWAYGQSYTFTLGTAPVNGAITTTLLGSVSSTHGNSMGARTIMPAVSCTGTTCTVQAPPNANICPPGWYQFFVLDGGIPAVGVYVRVGGDPAGLGNWPDVEGFDTPGL